MDPAIYMQGTFDMFSLGGYLGLDGSETAERKALSNDQGLKLLQHYGVIPRRDVPARCSRCLEPLKTGVDRARYGWRYICTNHGSRLRLSPLDNTILSQTRLKGGMTADKVVCALFMWLFQNPLTKVQEYLAISAETAVSWYGLCRDVACAIAWHDYTPIGGAGDVVEVDECCLFKQSIWVLGGMSRTTKKCFAVIVKHRDSDTLSEALQQCIDGNSYICSPSSDGYVGCDVMFHGHGTVNQPRKFIHPPFKKPPLWMSAGTFNSECLDSQWKGNPPTPGQQPFRIHTQHIRRAWRGLKSILGSSSSTDVVSQYIGEWVYRKNILHKLPADKEKFVRFLSDVRRVYPGVGKVAMKTRYEDILDCFECHECMP